MKIQFNLILYPSLFVICNQLKNPETWITLFFISNGTDKPDCKKCLKALQELENIDDEADQLGIGFVKIADEQLADEYNLGPLPVLVYYRHQIPIIYERKHCRL